MSMEMYVLSSRRLQSIREWQRSASQLGFPIEFGADTDFLRTNGFLPVTWAGRKTGFECDHWLVEDLKEIFEQGHKLRAGDLYVLAFRWSGDFDECVAALQASAAYAVATEGTVFDPEQDSFVTAEAAVGLARETENALPDAHAAMEAMRKKFGEKPIL
jgi:hypothetical protein